MHKTKVIEILKQFTKYEIKELKKFLTHPFTNPGRNLLPLYKVLIKFYPGFDQKKLTHEYVFKKIYPVKLYNKKAYHLLEMLLSELSTVCEQFMFLLAMKKNKSEYYKILAREQMERELYSFADKNLMKSLKHLSQRKADINYFKNTYELYHMLDNILLKNIETKKAVECQKLLEKSFVIYSFMRGAEILDNINHNKTILNADFKPCLLENLLKTFNIQEMLEFVDNNEFENSELFEMYLYIFIMQLNPYDENIYTKLKSLHKKLYNSISIKENFKLILIIGKITEKLRDLDEAKYLSENFELYKELIENNNFRLLKQSSIPIPFYRSVVNTSIQIGELDWAENFIKEFHKKIHPDYRNTAYNFAMAYVNFYRKDYDRALDQLNQCEFKIFEYKFDYRLLTMQIYFELNYDEELIYNISSFKHFINNNLKVSGGNKKNHLNFVKYLNQLIKFRSEKNKIPIDSLISDMLKSTELCNKSWLLNKAYELKGSSAAVYSN